MSRTYKERNPVWQRWEKEQPCKRFNVRHWPVPSWYTRMLRQDYRAKANQSLQNGEEIPVEKHNSQYYW